MSSLVSIIMPHFNTVQYIEASILSVVSQTHIEWEILIIDDASDLEQYERLVDIASFDDRINLIRLDKNSGAAVARNKGIELAKGRYIAFLDSDDVWFPTKLDEQIKFMRSNDVAFSYCSYEKVDEKGNVFGVVGVPDKVSYSDLLKVCSIGCLTAIYDAKKLGKIHMPLIRKRQDLGLWLRILKEVPYAYATPGVLAQYRVRSDSISANKRVAAQYTWRLYREIEGLSLLAASYYFLHYAVNGVLRTKFPNLARFLGALE